MIDVVGKMIKASLLQEIKDALLYIIIVDKVTYHNTELMDLCVQFVDQQLKLGKRI